MVNFVVLGLEHIFFGNTIQPTTGALPQGITVVVEGVGIICNLVFLTEVIHGSLVCFSRIFFFFFWSGYLGRFLKGETIR